jgi:hypothetical protein
MTNARSSRRLVRSLLGGTLLTGVLAAIGLGTVGALAPTMASADTGTTNFSCTFSPVDQSSFNDSVPIDVTGSIPSTLTSGSSFKLSAYDVKITIPQADVQTIESETGATNMTGSAQSVVDMVGANPSSPPPVNLGNFTKPLPNPAAKVTFSLPASDIKVGPFTATSSAVAALAGRIDLSLNEPDMGVACYPPSNLVIAQTAVNGSGPFALVANDSDGTATAFDPSVGAPATALPVNIGGEPDYVAMTPDGSQALVSTWPDGTDLVPVNTRTLQVGTTIPIEAPRGVAITPDGSTAWVAGGSGDDTFYPVDLSNDSVGTGVSLGTNIGFGGSAASVAITPDGSTAYVVGQYVGLVRVDLATESVESPVALSGDGMPGEVQITPDGHTAIVTDGDQFFYLDITQDPAVVLGTSKPCGTGVGLSRFAISPDGTTAWVGCESAGTVVPVNIATESAGTPVALGSGNDSLGAMAISPDGKTLYIGDQSTDQVLPVNLTTDAVGTAIPTGRNPGGMALPPDQGPKAFLSVSSDQADPSGLTEDFDASGSQPGSSPIVSYRWHFGDGSSDVTTTVPTTSHAYAAAGTYTATVTETDAAGTSTTVVSTGQEILRNGSAAATASATFTLSSCATGCTPTQSNGNTTSQVTQEGSTTGTLTLSVSPGQLDCVANYQQRHQITTLTESSTFSSATPIQTKETITGLATTKGVKVCYQPGGASPPAPKYLPSCKKHPAPCVKSTQVTSPSSVVATLEVPPGDPRYWVDTGILGLSTFTPLSAAPGATVTIKGSNLKQVVSVLFSSRTSGAYLLASTLTISSTGTSMKAKVPPGAVTGPVEVVTTNGDVYISTKRFTVT